MNRTLTKTALGIGVALVLSATTACGSDSDPGAAVQQDCKPAHPGLKTLKKGVISVSAHPSLPYFDYDQSTGEVGGVDGDVMKAIADMECLKLDVKVIPGAGALQGVQSGNFDSSVAGWYITDERTAVMGMTDPFYYDFTSIISKDGVDKVSDLKGKKVGIVAGSVFVRPLQSILGKDNVRTYQLADAVVNDLAAGRIDAAVLGSGQAGFLAKKKGNGELKVKKALSEPGFNADEESGKIGFPFNKAKPELGAAMNEDLAKLRENGTVKDVLEKYGMTDPNNYEPQS